MINIKGSTRNRYKTEKKKEIVRLVLEEGRTIASVNREFNLRKELALHSSYKIHASV